METGLGGLYDSTNVVDRRDKVSVLTRIGFDHMAILGKTLKKITYQKATIINHDSQAIALDQSVEIKKVIKEVADDRQAKLDFVKKVHLNLSLLGDYQMENAGLALKTLELLAKRDSFKNAKTKIKQVFRQAHFAGRFDIKKIRDRTVILDGAHNPLKMESFTAALKSKYQGKKFHFLIAFKKGKDYQNMLRYIVPLASKITITSFFVDNQDLINLSEKPKEIGRALEKLGFKNYKIIADSKKAFETILKETKDTVVITGSLYLLGEIYKIITNDK